MLPSQVRAAPWEDELLVAAYCQLEQEEWERERRKPPTPLAPSGTGVRTHTVTQSINYIVKKKEK